MSDLLERLEHLRDEMYDNDLYLSELASRAIDRIQSLEQQVKELEALKVIANNARYSNEFVGNLFRGTFPIILGDKDG